MNMGLRNGYHRSIAVAIVALITFTAPAAASGVEWRRHVVTEGFRTNTAVAADFTGDGRFDIIANCGPCEEDVLFVAPDWKRVVLGKTVNGIYSAVLDMDGDGDLDYVGARYSPGFIYWLERPANPLRVPWKMHVVDDHAAGGVNGVHGFYVGDVNRDGKPDLIANSGEPKGAFPSSLAWFEAPGWKRHIFAAGDAPGLSHYFGFGDVNGDGRPDIASAAKIPPDGNWFAWWQAPADPRGTWQKRIIATGQEGASNIAIVDVNGDRRPDFLASRGHGKGLVWFEAPDWKAHEIDSSHPYPHSLAVGDIDGDGDIDAAACSAVYGREPAKPLLAWYENDGRGRFTAHTIDGNQAAYDTRLADMDGDGDLDVLVAGQETRNVVWFENLSGVPRRSAGR